jgi:3-oxoacyl-[acyl-carrier-protein] synthase-3
VRLVIGAEVFSRILDWSDRGTCVLFGDGAGAVVLAADDEPGILASKLHADGRYEEILRTAGNVRAAAITGHPFLTPWTGRRCSSWRCRCSIRSHAKRSPQAGLRIGDIDWLIPHQANVRIMSGHRPKKLGISMDRVIVTVDQHAQYSAASIPLALDTAVRDGRITRGQSCCSWKRSRGGFTWGATLLKF